MNGMDPGAIGQLFLTYFGGPGGAYIAGASGVIVWILCGAQWMHPKAGWTTMGCIFSAWIVAWTLRLIGWV